MPEGLLAANGEPGVTVNAPVVPFIVKPQTSLSDGLGT